MLRSIYIFAALAVSGAATTTSVWAEAPQLKTPSPAIYLSDNLGEPQDLGWCIDTLGRGYAENLQAHSCKPQGGDVQFAYSPETNLISSVPYAGKCMSLRAAPTPTAFSLEDCDLTQDAQKFVYTSTNGQISPAADVNKCVAVGEEIRQAGPFSSRDLDLVDCNDVAQERSAWTIRDE
ncbi:Ricin-type beta-trefoil lectin domain protein [Pseudovibrio axinellae]|uniref:Ricin-type beta-trefoil lectin domain protein n=1 Tax=Pseudovibrio axinellae TaxID=989403 RepID=A0A165T4D1_9HYPH|nr:RICIN domain-containing protein [Pseudovibrio axinellae]KZL05412.1 Ricin-type beta-trefoil lectin domain protein [Pseudovibrio axinellae]SEQ00361.1 hypothetical protein SAMN05421798_101920 [Pseudovibrio axinellae]